MRFLLAAGERLPISDRRCTMPFRRRAVIGRSLCAAHTVTERRSLCFDGRGVIMRTR
jgi:hypothetical protein